MKKLLFSLLIGLGAFVHSACAITVTINIATADTLDIDIAWGQTAPTFVVSDHNNLCVSALGVSPLEISGEDHPLSSLPLPGVVILEAIPLQDCFSFQQLSELGRIDFNIGASRLFGAAGVSICPSFPCTPPWVPTVVESSDGGYGAHVVYHLTCPTVTATISGGTTICPGAQATLTVSAPSGGTSPYTLSLSDGSPSQTGVGPFTFNVSPSNNTSYTASGTDAHSCPVTVNGTASVMVDNSAPVASCQDVTVYLNASGQATLTPPQVDNGSSSTSCGAVTLALDKTSVDCSNVGNPVTVTLTVTDTMGNQSTCTAKVTVVDNTPPTITCPPNQTANATCLTGAAVTFPAPTASDNCSTTTINCSPSSGSTFAIGTTTVTCTATDGSGNPSAPCSFTVHVRGAVDQINDLIAYVNSLTKVPVTVRQGLLAKLQAALAAVQVNDTLIACARMQDFINLVNAQFSKKLITVSVDAALLQPAKQIRCVIGCSP